MSSLADLHELRGFFSYSREDDEDSHGGLSALRDRIQRELRSQLGRSTKTFGLWQDKEAIAPGAQWEAEIKKAVAQSVFFIPIITPTVIKSKYCRFELQSFLDRQAALDRNDLVFPILYINVAALDDDDERRRSDPVLSIIAERQYEDWRQFRHWDVNSREVKEAIERFCRGISAALQRSWLSPEDRKRQGEVASLQRAEVKRLEQEAEVKRSEHAAETKRREKEIEAKRLQAIQREVNRRRQETEEKPSREDNFTNDLEKRIEKELPQWLAQANLGTILTIALVIAVGIGLINWIR